MLQLKVNFTFFFLSVLSEIVVEGMLNDTGSSSMPVPSTTTLRSVVQPRSVRRTETSQRYDSSANCVEMKPDFGLLSPDASKVSVTSSVPNPRESLNLVSNGATEHLENLPWEMLQKLMQTLSMADLISLAKTSKLMREAVRDQILLNDDMLAEFMSKRGSLKKTFDISDQDIEKLDSKDSCNNG